MTSNRNKNHNRIVMSVATLLIALCIGFIVLLVKAANQQSFLVVFVVAFIIAILIIFFTAKDSLK